MKMRTIPAHCHYLAEALRGIGGENYELYDVSSFLEIASGIQKIDCSTWAYERHPGVCESADDYRDEQDALWSALTHKLSLFLLVWASIETYADVLPLALPPKIPGRKQRWVDSPCHYISTQLKQSVPEKYEDVLRCFKLVAAEAEIGRGVAVMSQYPEFVASASEGLYLVSEYRNAFAHGDFSIPTPDGDPLKHPDIMVVGTAIRLLLLTIQILTLCRYSPEEVVEMPSILAFTDEGDLPRVKDAFHNLHMMHFDDIHKDA